MKRKRAWVNGLAIAVGAVVLGGGCSGKKAPEGSDGATEIHAAAVKEVPLDPAAKEWNTARELVVELMPQGVAFPMLQKVTVTKLAVRALVDPNWLGLKLSWEDPSQSDALDVDQFTDAVAIELPVGDPDKTNPMMGSKENPVYIAHWKAVWQRDTDTHRADVQDRYPNFWSDGYPFVSGGHPYPVEESFQSANARRYLPGVAAANPVSKLAREWPVEELHATGFGSLADHRFQDARARGKWADGKWQVVLAVPRLVADHANPRLPKGAKSKVAFAVWEGKDGQVAGRKQWYSFVDLVLP